MRRFHLALALAAVSALLLATAPLTAATSIQTCDVVINGQTVNVQATSSFQAQTSIQPGTKACVNPCDGQPDGTACTDDGNECTDDVCQGGQCTHPVADNGSACTDDGNECTGDICVAGACQHPNLPLGAGCTDDGNNCTFDVCNGGGACAHPPLPNNAPCDDGDGEFCTIGLCQGGTCQAGTQLPNGTECPRDQECCTRDICQGGMCTHPPVVDGRPCRTAENCRKTDRCTATPVGPSPACTTLVIAMDFDSDGVSDELDNCFVLYNPDQEDLDFDGDGDLCDCSPNNPEVNAFAIEVCNGVDDDCDGQIDEGYDLDGDLVTSCAGDCDDTSATVSPLLEEGCNDGVDNNCDGQIDEGCVGTAPYAVQSTSTSSF
jgi:hypothetical protein